ncbi:MAG: putative ATPase [Halonotius sp. J07HN4]|nr:MAG: putative ATPase [Halonotius sp. J07HN4]
MTSEETITVADVSVGPGGTDEINAGTPVELPVVDLLTGRGFITGKSGSGKSNTASVILENLLDNNFPVLIVDSDGEYYGLKEAYEILHVGADEECDIQVTADHAEKIASLALEENIPIILDVSGYLDDDDANELLLETARHLFAKEKKLKKPFLLVVEECHEYIPEQGGMGEAGKMLIKIGKRGRKHGLGVVGISQRPADVKKDFITQCDWLVWHRLTWRNDTKVVGRILGSEYADAVEELGDGEGFLVADWSADIRRVQFHRKETFDAGATPGLEDIEQPELKSVSDDLVSELTEISDEKARRESELADLRQELDKKEATITQLEQELEDARDLSRMADQFAQAMLQRSEAAYRQTAPPAENEPAAADQPADRSATADTRAGERPTATADTTGAQTTADGVFGDDLTPADFATAVAGGDDRRRQAMTIPLAMRKTPIRRLTARSRSIRSRSTPQR